MLLQHLERCHSQIPIVFMVVAGLSHRTKDVEFERVKAIFILT